MGHGNIQVFVRAGLVLEQGIDCPTSIQDHLDLVTLKESDHLEHIFGSHFWLNLWHCAHLLFIIHPYQTG
jgi:hypothetical protein